MPVPEETFQSPPLPISEKGERNFPKMLSPVPAANVAGHEQTHRCLISNSVQEDSWIFLLPLQSFVRCCRTNVLGEGKEKSQKIPVPTTAYLILDTVCFHEQLARNEYAGQ